MTYKVGDRVRMFEFIHESHSMYKHMLFEFTIMHEYRSIWGIKFTILYASGYADVIYATSLNDRGMYELIKD